MEGLFPSDVWLHILRLCRPAFLLRSIVPVSRRFYALAWRVMGGIQHPGEADFSDDFTSLVGNMERFGTLSCITRLDLQSCPPLPALSSISLLTALRLLQLSHPHECFYLTRLVEAGLPHGVRVEGLLAANVAELVSCFQPNYSLDVSQCILHPIMRSAREHPAQGNLTMLQNCSRISLVEKMSLPSEYSQECAWILPQLTYIELFSPYGFMVRPPHPLHLATNTRTLRCLGQGYLPQFATMLASLPRLMDLEAVDSARRAIALALPRLASQLTRLVLADDGAWRGVDPSQTEYRQAWCAAVPSFQSLFALEMPGGASPVTWTSVCSIASLTHLRVSLLPDRVYELQRVRALLRLQSLSLSALTLGHSGQLTCLAILTALTQLSLHGAADEPRPWMPPILPSLRSFESAHFTVLPVFSAGSSLRQLRRLALLSIPAEEDPASIPWEVVAQQLGKLEELQMSWELLRGMARGLNQLRNLLHVTAGGERFTWYQLQMLAKELS